MQEVVQKLEHKGVKPTANRMLVYQLMMDQHRPLSLRDIEEQLLTLDKSSIFRTLTLFLQHDVIHAFEDGRGVVHYELCRHHDDEDHTGSHVHFYCESCGRTYCIEQIALPEIHLPEEYHVHSMSFVVKGVCPECQHHTMLA